ncbi:MAG: 16S rRNA (guanine(966)-N(2))-methyltransferase RsmD [Alphaproteobacteria bacterium]|nr:16S rRNA (guanine(966)-N(2))-methyltransferase RsmD [Alphaproteobacteria bacterium]
MRVISGKWGGTRLVAPKGRGPRPTTRPTSGRNREALFSMLGARLDFDGLKILDAFAGSGALGLEALSRGAAHCTFIENDHAACATIQQNIAICGAADATTLIRRDVRKVNFKTDFGGAAFDLVLLDPPYGKGLGDALLPLLPPALADDALLVLEEDRRCALVAPDGFDEIDRRVKGDTALTFLTKR